MPGKMVKVSAARSAICDGKSWKGGGNLTLGLYTHCYPSANQLRLAVPPAAAAFLTAFVLPADRFDGGGFLLVSGFGFRFVSGFGFPFVSTGFGFGCSVLTFIGGVTSRSGSRTQPHLTHQTPSHGRVRLRGCPAARWAAHDAATAE